MQSSNQKKALRQLAKLDPAISYRLIVREEEGLYDIMEALPEALKARVKECEDIESLLHFSFSFEKM